MCLTHVKKTYICQPEVAVKCAVFEQKNKCWNTKTSRMFTFIEPNTEITLPEDIPNKIKQYSKEKQPASTLFHFQIYKI